MIRNKRIRLGICDISDRSTHRGVHRWLMGDILDGVLGKMVILSKA
jgi:hypothetical protein